jgi:hypothetical protein
MQKAWRMLTVLAVAFALVAGLQAADDKEATLKGKITCAKCELKKADKCTTVLVVKEKGKDVIYYFDKDGHSKYHDDICTEGKNGSVTGTTSEKEGKKTIKVSKVNYDK